MSHTTSTQELIRLLPHWHYKVERNIRRQQKPRQISYETYFCLMTLKDCGQMKMGKLARAMRLSKQQATHMTDNLHRYSPVERNENPGDRRDIHIGIIAQGFRFLKESTLDATILCEQMLQKLSDREIAAFERTIHIMLEVLAKPGQQVGAKYKQLQRSTTIQSRNWLFYEVISKQGKEADHRCKPSFVFFYTG